MADNMIYLPGSNAVLIYIDRNGHSRSSIVEIIREKSLFGQTWYVVKATYQVLNEIGHIAPLLEFSNTDIEEGWSIGLVLNDQIKPVGTRSFHIVE